MLFNQDLNAACGGTTRTWIGTTTAWNTTTNWSGSNLPDTSSENVVIKSTGFNAIYGTSYSLGCLEIQSGTLAESVTGLSMTITGDYFSAPFQNSLSFTRSNFIVAMAGTGPQSFEAVDDIGSLTVNNSTSVSLKNDFRILGTLVLTGSGTTIVEGTVQLSSALTIPAGHRMIVKNGAALYSAGNLTVNGVLEIQDGGEVRMANGRTLSVPTGGAIEIVGSSGNPATLTSSNSSSWFTFTVAGSVTANYAIIKRTSSAGMNVTGTIIQLNNTDFRGMVNNGYGLTLGAAAVVPSNLNTIGFYNDDAVATAKNINANLYNLT